MKEIINIITEIDKIESKNRKDQCNQELVLLKDKTDKPLARLIKKIKVQNK